MAWQQARVGVSAQDNQLLIHDLESGELIATHDLCKAKGRMIKNNNHYRDHAQRITDLERGIDSILPDALGATLRSEEHTSELQSLMRISYAVFCLNKKTTIIHTISEYTYE